MDFIDSTITTLVNRLEDLQEDLSERNDCLNENQVARLSDLRDEITLLIEPQEPDWEPRRRSWSSIGA